MYVSNKIEETNPSAVPEKNHFKQQDPTAIVLGPLDFTLGGWIGTPSQENNLYAGQYYLQQMAACQQQKGVRSLDYFDEHYYPQFSSPATQLASTRTLWDPAYNGGTWVGQPTDPIAYAFRLYRNYDGTGSHFGETSIQAASTNPGELSVYGAQRNGRWRIDSGGDQQDPSRHPADAFASELYTCQRDGVCLQL